MPKAGQSAGSDAFDDLIMDPESAEGPGEQMETNVDEDDWSTPLEEEKPAPAKPAEGDADVDPDSQVNLLDEKEDAPKAPEKKPEPKAEDDKKPADTKPAEEAPKNPHVPKDQAATLYKDGQKFEVPKDAVRRVKVNGKFEKVTLEELEKNYSGHVAYGKKFEELETKNRELSAREQHVQRSQEFFKTTIQGTTEAVKSALAKGGNPLDAVNKIIDMLEVDSYDFSKALFEHMSRELSEYQDMDEVERRAFWSERRVQHLQKKHENFEKQQSAHLQRQERLAHVDRLRQAQNVSEDDYVSAFNQLSQQGHQPTPEQVVEFAASLPYFTKAESLMKPYEERLSDDELEAYIARTAVTLRQNKDLTESDVAEYLAEHFEVEPAVNDANRKAEKMGISGSGKSGRSEQTISQTDFYTSRNAENESFGDLET